MNLNVTFTEDSTGMSKDQVTRIPLITGHILYDYHSEGLNKSNNIESIVRNHLMLNKDQYLTIWKVIIEE